MHSHTLGCHLAAIAYKARLWWNRIRGRKVSTLDLHTQLNDDVTEDVALEQSLAVIGHALKQTGTDISEGTLRSHVHDLGEHGTWLHAVWIHDEVRDRMEAEANAETQ